MRRSIEDRFYDADDISIDHESFSLFTQEMLKQWNSICQLQEFERLFDACHLLKGLCQAYTQYRGQHYEFLNPRQRQLLDEFESDIANDPRLMTLRKEEKETLSLMEEFESSDWSDGSNGDGIASMYKIPSGSNTVTIKVEMSVPRPVFECLCVLNEIDLLPTWFYGLVSAEPILLWAASRRAVYARQWMPWPMQNRDALIEGRFVDLTAKKQAMILLKSVDCETLRRQYGVPNLTVPSESDTTRINILFAGFKATYLTDDSTKMEVVFNIDPCMAMPYSVINFFVRKCAYQTGKILRDKICAIKGSVYEERLKEDKLGVYKLLKERLYGIKVL